MKEKYGTYFIGLMFLSLPFFIWLMVRGEKNTLVGSKENLKTVLDETAKKKTAASLPTSATTPAPSNPAAAAAQKQTQVQPQNQIENKADEMAGPSEVEENDNPDQAGKDTDSEEKDAAKKHFSGTQLKLSFDYDEKFNVEEFSNRVSVSKDAQKWELWVYDNKEGKNLEDWFSDKYGSRKLSQCDFVSSDVSVGELDAKTAKNNEESDSCQEPGIYALDSKNKKIIRVQSNDPCSDIKDILKTVKLAGD